MQPHDLFPVVNGAKMALVASDGKGTLVSDFEYDSVHFVDGFYITIKDGVKGYIDSEGHFTQDEEEKFFNCAC